MDAFLGECAKEINSQGLAKFLRRCVETSSANITMFEVEQRVLRF